MGWGDVRYCFAMAILVIIITSPRLLSGDVLLFYVSFSLLLQKLPHTTVNIPTMFHEA
jgi:hypothetical protein